MRAVAELGRAAGRRRGRHAGAALYWHGAPPRRRWTGCAIRCQGQRALPDRRGRHGRGAGARRRRAPGMPALSWWQGRGGLNDVSLGIELVNPGHEWGYRPFPERADGGRRGARPASWSAAGASRPVACVAHSDIAPARKEDPGELFDWRRLAAAGIGAWPQPQRAAAAGRRERDDGTGPDRLSGVGAGRAASRSPCVRSSVASGQTRCDGVLDAETMGLVARGRRLVQPAPRRLPRRRCRRPDGRSRPAGGGGKSGLHGNTVPGNARRGRPQGKCHREQTARRGMASAGLRVRVKGCGKSAPRRRQRRWHGKPHREQDQVGTTAPSPARVLAQACFRAGRPGRSREARGDAGPRGMAIPRPSGRGQNPAYRPPAPIRTEPQMPEQKQNIGAGSDTIGQHSSTLSQLIHRTVPVQDFSCLGRGLRWKA